MAPGRRLPPRSSWTPIYELRVNAGRLSSLAVGRAWSLQRPLVARRVVTAARRVGFAGLPVLAVLPSLAWIAVDQRVWFWDQAYYGEVSVILYDTLRHRPLDWPNHLLSAFDSRAPGIAWFGQLFVPLGQALNSVEIGLLLLIVMVQTCCLAPTARWQAGEQSQR
jgi:hypothetical protein